VFIEQARKIWGNRYDYSESEYINGKKPIVIYCPKHDHHFKVGMAQNHLMKHNATGCPVCAAEKRYGCEYGTDWRKYLKLCAKSNRVGKIENCRLDSEEAARRKAERDRQREEAARRKAERDRQRKEAKAQRWQAYQVRLQQQKEETRRRHEAERTARQQAREQRERQRIQDLQDRVRREGPLTQGDGYIYKGVEQVTSTQSTVMVHCPNPDHDWHPMRVDLILQGCKCRECAGRHQPLKQRYSDFIRRSKKKYKNLFDYSRVPSQYVNNDTPVEIRCLQHNYWFSVTPDTHLRKYGGCPICGLSKGELTIFLWLRDHHIRFEKEPIWHHHNERCLRGYLRPDFWLPDYSLAIEYNGEQHYREVAYFKKRTGWTLADQQERDKTLRQLCHENNIQLLEIPYTEFDNISEILAKTLLRPNA
jgi:serine protease inhibitor ecotin